MAQDQPIANTAVKDPMTDQETVAAVSRNATGSLLYVGCDVKSQSMFVRFQPGPRSRVYIHRGDVVQHRFDDDPPLNGMWETDDVSADINDAEQVAAFASRMLSAGRFLVRVHQGNGRQVDASFQIFGETPSVRDAIAKAVNACSASKEAALLAKVVPTTAASLAIPQ
ncbi:hypothetical protein LZK98_08215 [Sphingomonas cannabina]|uniref:hypothetical protein n=1 Tax=Sphingomonas cannabina TaxID=2899123 RepID=UPI001F217A52|nr:hypothetical protein [Sphingomonas cannabina]UIJ46913.1 hypothetical protein LZK98_08215 [Sphingomonas cannabina]